MTMQDERYRAVKCARELLWALLNPSETPGIPLAIRRRARSVLKHFPTSLDMDLAANYAPEIFEKEHLNAHKAP